MENLSHIHGVVFDVDDTLYPERDFVRSGYRAVGEYLRELLDRSNNFEDWLTFQVKKQRCINPGIDVSFAHKLIAYHSNVKLFHPKLPY